jgi:hypothetical protein
MTASLLLLLVLTQPGPEAQVTPASRESPEAFHVRGSLEAASLLFLERSPVRRAEGFLTLLPSLTLEAGEHLGCELQVPLRLRILLEDASTQQVSAPWRVRAQDWDERSDFGQLLRLLRLGEEGGPIALVAGSLEDYTLLSGHLVRSYSNQLNPDYHPSGAYLTALAAPLYMELFTSDVLAARLVAGALSVDVGPWLGAPPDEPHRHTLSISLAHDFARAGGVSPPVTLAHADALAGLVYRPDLQLFAVGGVGKRLDTPESSLGVVAGLALELLSPSLQVSARLEGRLQRGGFHQGFFGPFYELSRFAAPGAAALPAAQEHWPDGASGYGEVRLRWDSLHLEQAEPQVNLALAFEAFSWGRVDAEARVELRPLRRRWFLAARGAVEGWKMPGARHLATGEVRYRVMKPLYVLLQGGTLFFVQPSTRALPATFITLGVGMDSIR